MSSTVEDKPRKPRFQLKIPHTLTILLCIVLFAGLLTYIVPAGEYARVKVGNRTVVDPAKFNPLPQRPVSPYGWFKAVPQGIAAAGEIIAVIFIAIGGMGVYTETGAVQASMGTLLRKGGKNSAPIIMLAIMVFLSIRSGFEGALESQLAFTPLTLSFALAAGYDTMTGVAMCMLPAIVSHAMAPTNPYIGLVAQEIAGLPPFSGMGLRIVGWVVVSLITWWYVLRYASMVKKDPSRSIVADIDISDLKTGTDLTEMVMTTRQKILMVMLGVTVVFVVLGAAYWKVGLVGIAAIFLISGILAGLVAGYDNERIAKIFVAKGSSMYFGAVCIGTGRAIQIVLENGKIIDSIIRAISIPLQNVSGMVSAIAMYFVQLGMDFFIPSGSGQAVATMPIMAPLSDLIGVTRQTAALALQLGDGITNMIYPTSALVWAWLAFGKIPYDRYVKFGWKLFVEIIAVGLLMMIYAQATHYGPF